jgi:hypothetical protein
VVKIFSEMSGVMGGTTKSTARQSRNQKNKKCIENAHFALAQKILAKLRELDR